MFEIKRTRFNQTNEQTIFLEKERRKRCNDKKRFKK